MSGSVSEFIGGTYDAIAIFEPLYRTELTRLRARLAVAVGDVALADKLVQDAFAAAVDQWQRDGVPSDPDGWLAAAAASKAGMSGDALVDDDALLAMLFTCCDPSVPEASRVALTLRFVCGLPSSEIATTLADVVPALDAPAVAVRVPAERDARLDDVMAVVSAVHRLSLVGEPHDPARGELALHATAIARKLTRRFPASTAVAELLARLS